MMGIMKTCIDIGAWYNSNLSRVNVWIFVSVRLLIFLLKASWNKGTSKTFLF